MVSIRFDLRHGRVREQIRARIEERLPASVLSTAHEPIEVTVSAILRGLDEWFDRGEVSETTVDGLTRAGERVCNLMAWSLIDEVVICITEVLLDELAGRQHKPSVLTRAVMEISNHFFDGYWIFEGKTAMEQAVRFGRLAERIPSPVFLADGSGRITFVNEALAEAVASTPMELLGQSLRGVFGVDPALLDGGVFTAEVTRGPASRHLDVTLLAIPGEEGVEFFGSVRDRTHEVELEATKRQVVATISHELRTPLTAVLGYLQLLLEGGSAGLTEAERRTALETMHGEADLLLRLVHDLVDYAHLDTGRFQLEPSVFLVEDAVASVVRRVFANRTDRVNVSVTAGMEISADRARIEQLLTNLAGNAERYGGINVEMAVWADDTTVHMRVSDDGAGIAVDRRDRIFDLFYQGHDLLGVGAGIGLAVCRAVVRAHGGTIHLEDGRGASFHVVLPDALA